MIANINLDACGEPIGIGIGIEIDKRANYCALDPDFEFELSYFDHQRLQLIP